MKKIHNTNGGYIGLIMILISVAIIAFIIIRTDLFTGDKGGKNVIEQGKSDIQKAQDVKDILEKNNLKSITQ